MLNFIIYDEDNYFLKKNKKIIDKYMMKCDHEYKCYLFQEYSEELDKILGDNLGLKIYLLDIENKTKSGLDVVRDIREKYDDWSSIIIMITSHNEFKYDVLCNRLYLMDFINKLDNLEKILTEDIERIVKVYDNTSECLTYVFRHNLKRIEYKNIVYIEKEKYSKKCIIHTLYGNHEIGGTINEVLSFLNKDFVKISRSTIINLKHVAEYDKANNIIVFKNGDNTTDTSRSFKKDVINSVNELAH